MKNKEKEGKKRERVFCTSTDYNRDLGDLRWG